jgi:hypothetical protein
VRRSSPLALLLIAAGLAAPAFGGAALAQEPTPATSPALAADTTYGCVVCHSDKRRAFVQGVHSERGIRCHDCHGGSPSALEAAPAHSGDFLGTPGKVEIVRLCGSCHSDVERMRPFGLPADQVAEYRTSRHGQLLLEEGNTDVPTCSDCHDAHTILPPDDARSSVYPARIPMMCGKCHADEDHMAPFGTPTGQLADFRQSAHGIALLENENFTAPSCVGCHGSHSALPPRVLQIANVCGRCHVLVRQEFEAGPHQAAAREGKIAGCTACHANHRTEAVPPEQIGATCVGCHDSQSAAAMTGAEVQELMVGASRELEAAEEALTRLVRAGHRVDTERFRYQTARTAFLQFKEVQHSLNLERLEELSLRIGSISRDIRSGAEAVEEQRWEHKLLLAPIWFLTLAAVVLAWFRLRDEARRQKKGGNVEEGDR